MGSYSEFASCNIDFWVPWSKPAHYENQQDLKINKRNGFGRKKYGKLAK